MRYLFSIFTVLMLTISSPAQTLMTYQHDGMIRSYYVYIPDGMPENAPLVFVLHGYTSSASIISGYSEMTNQADLHKFAVCYPQGTPAITSATHWNANLSISSVDDVGYLTELAQYLQAEYQLNPDHTFSCGMSNGGFMSYTLACERPDVFKAIASVTGTMSGYDWDNCNPSEVVPVFQISGYDDTVVPFDGDWDTPGGWVGAPGAVAVNNFWKDLNQTAESEIVSLSNNLEAEYNTGGINGNQVWFYPIENWGHSWPTTLSSNFTGIVAAEEIWDFFSLVIDRTTSTESHLEELTIQVSPNPTKDFLTVSLPSGKVKAFRVINKLGQEVLHGRIDGGNQEINLGKLPADVYFLVVGHEVVKISKI